MGCGVAESHLGMAQTITKMSIELFYLKCNFKAVWMNVVEVLEEIFNITNNCLINATKSQFSQNENVALVRFGKLEGYF